MKGFHYTHEPASFNFEILGGEGIFLRGHAFLVASGSSPRGGIHGCKVSKAAALNRHPKPPDTLNFLSNMFLASGPKFKANCHVSEFPGIMYFYVCMADDCSARFSKWTAALDHMRACDSYQRPGDLLGLRGGLRV